MHAEATSEKVALGYYLDGQVAAVIGTHTHVQTADERILAGGTACLTDVGMTGPHDGVIGMDKDAVIARFVTGAAVAIRERHRRSAAERRRHHRRSGDRTRDTRSNASRSAKTQLKANTDSGHGGARA